MKTLSAKEANKMTEKTKDNLINDVKSLLKNNQRFFDEIVFFINNQILTEIKNQKYDTWIEPLGIKFFCKLILNISKQLNIKTDEVSSLVCNEIVEHYRGFGYAASISDSKFDTIHISWAPATTKRQTR